MREVGGDIVVGSRVCFGWERDRVGIVFRRAGNTCWVFWGAGRREALGAHALKLVDVREEREVSDFATREFLTGSLICARFKSNREPVLVLLGIVGKWVETLDDGSSSWEIFWCDGDQDGMVFSDDPEIEVLVP